MIRDNRDLAILIVNKLVEEGLIPDCTDRNYADPDYEIEWEVQDIIEDVLDKYLFTNKKIEI